ARVLVERAHQAGTVLHRRFAEPRVELGAERDVAHVAAGPHDHRPAGADVDDLLSLIDVAVGPVALQPLAGLRAEGRRVACLDADDPAGVATLADDLVEVPVHHELHARLAASPLKRARDDEAAAYASRSAPDVARCAGGEAGLRVEGRLPFLRQVA